MANKNKIPSLVGWILQKLKDKTKNKEGLNFSSDSQVTFTLMDYNNETISFVGANGASVPAVKIREGFYLYVSIGYILIGKNNKLDSISFQVFDNSRLLFRVEWNEKKLNDMIHPQPHWHFHPYMVANGNEESDSGTFADMIAKNNGFEKLIKANNKYKKVDICGMHLPMDYNIASDPYGKNWDADRIKKWADITIDVIFNELDFVILKGHSAN